MVYKNNFSKINDFNYLDIPFKVRVTIQRGSIAGHVKVEIFTEQWESIDLILLHDITGIDTAIELLKQSVYNYVEENADELDKLFVALNDGGEF